MSTLRNSLFAVALSLSSLAAFAGPDVVGLNLVSSHSENTYYDHGEKMNRAFQNTNTGMYAIWIDNRARGNSRFFAGVGAYANSVHRTTVHADFGIEYDLVRFTPDAVLRVGAMAGLATGYAEAFSETMPVLLNTLTPIGNVFALVPLGGPVSMRVSYIPPVKESVGVVHASVEVRF